MSAVTGATEIAARTAAVLCWVAAVGYGAPAPQTARHLLVNRELPVIWGFRAYGGGFFERLGIHPFVVLLARSCSSAPPRPARSHSARDRTLPDGVDHR